MPDYTLREYGILVRGRCTEPSLDMCGIDSELAWAFLETLACSADKRTRFIEFTQAGGRRALRVCNFVGVIAAPDGTQIEILPKTSELGQDLGDTRALLWKMLGVVDDLPFLETTGAQLMVREQPLSEALVSIFLKGVASLVRSGIRKDYERIEAEERFLRGRLRTMQQLRQAPGRGHLFQIEYDIFSENRAENRLVHSALLHAGRWSRSEANQRLARELRHGLDTVPLSLDYTADLSAWRTGRDMVHYQQLLPWVKLILNRESPFSLKGAHEGISFLFPMETLFERYVARLLARALPPGEMAIHNQLRSKYLSDAPQAFLLKPDLAISIGKRLTCILDTKWKLIGGEADNGISAGIASADMYQMFAYGHKYLGGRGRLVLIYPKWSGFSAPLPPYRLADGLELEAVPFDLSNGPEEALATVLAAPAVRGG